MIGRDSTDEAKIYRCGAAARWLPRVLAGAVLATAMLVALRLPPASGVPAAREFRVGLVVLAFSLQSVSRSLEWRDNRSIFEAAARVNPDSPRAHFVLGKLTLESGDPVGAIEHLDRALALRPDHPTAWLEKS